MFFSKAFFSPSISALTVLIVIGLSACSAHEQGHLQNEIAYQACSEPRPQKCTMNYDPVCAIDREGERSTKSNGCRACAEETVVKYSLGSCESGAERPIIKVIK